MLDKQTKRLLGLLVKMCGDNGEYKILEIPELIDALPGKARITPEFIQTTSKFLADMELIDIRHSDENNLAVAVLPRGRIYKEDQKLAAQSKRYNRGLLGLIVFGSFLAAFIASLLANVIVNSLWG